MVIGARYTYPPERKEEEREREGDAKIPSDGYKTSLPSKTAVFEFIDDHRQRRRGLLTSMTLGNHPARSIHPTGETIERGEKLRDRSGFPTGSNEQSDTVYNIRDSSRIGTVGER